jgi:hypothetical protein
MNPQSSPYLTVKQFAQKHPAFPEGGLRHKIFHSDQNGLAKSGAILRDGRKVLLNETKFFGWLENMGEK